MVVKLLSSKTIDPVSDSCRQKNPSINLELNIFLTINNKIANYQNTMTQYLKTRKYPLHKNNNYMIQSKGLIVSWKILNWDKIKRLIVKHPIVIRLVNLDTDLSWSSGQLEDPAIFSCAKFRQNIRSFEEDALFENPILINIDRVLFHEQIDAMMHYTHLLDSQKPFYNSWFTMKLDIQLQFKNKFIKSYPDLEIEETYYEFIKPQATTNNQDKKN